MIAGIRNRLVTKVFKQFEYLLSFVQLKKSSRGIIFQKKNTVSVEPQTKEMVNILSFKLYYFTLLMIQQ